MSGTAEAAGSGSFCGCISRSLTLTKRFVAQIRSCSGQAGPRLVCTAHHFRHVGFADDSAALPILQALESDLAPTDLQSEVLSVLVRGSVPAIGRLKGEDWEQYEMRMAAASERLGERAAARLDVLAELAPQLLVVPEGRIELFGRGLGRRASDLSAVWSSLITAVIATPIERLVPSLPRGFIYVVSKRDPEAVQTWLDACLTDKHTVAMLLALHDAVGWD